MQWGMPMGPLRLIDEIGIDITVDIADTLEKAYGARDRAPEILRKMHDAKMLGRKVRRRLLQIRRQTADAERGVAGMAAGSPARSLATRRTSRTASTFLMVNEAARCLEEKVVASAGGRGLRHDSRDRVSRLSGAGRCVLRRVMA